MISSLNYNPHWKYVLAHRACTFMIFGCPIPILLPLVIELVLNFEDCGKEFYFNNISKVIDLDDRSQGNLEKVKVNQNMYYNNYYR
jgi:hypothetical protein